MKWRTGMHVGRTIYLQTGPEPTKQDPLIGVMDTPGLAQQVVDAVNEKTQPQRQSWSIPETDLRMDVFGEHWLKITHIPTRVTVQDEVETSKLKTEEKLIAELYAHPAVIEYYEGLARQVVDAVNGEQGQAKRDWSIPQDDLRTDTFTNHSDAGIRLTHIPTDVTVQAEVETSKLKTEEKLIAELYAHPAVVEYYERLVT